MAEFARFVAQHREGQFDDQDYVALHDWSVNNLEDFWAELWAYFEVVTHRPYSRVKPSASADDIKWGRGWFEGATLNYAENALRHGDDGAVAVIAEAEDGSRAELTWAELRERVGSVAEWLRAVGVHPGDRVVGYLANGPHAVIAFLASAAVGAVWSCCGPDYGVQGALSRFAQLEPVVLFATDGYHWNGSTYDRRDQIPQLQAGLPRLLATVLVDHLGPDRRSEFESSEQPTPWREVIGQPQPPRFTAQPAEAPLWVLFSSGTTGAPKGIVHSHAGVVVEHLKLVGLHLNLREGDRFFWYTSTNWMMWNVQVSGLLVGATIVTYDGSPTRPNVDRLWELSSRHQIDVLGTSPAYLHGCIKAGSSPAREHDLQRLKVVGVTGSTMPAETCDWLYDHLDPRVHVSCGSGGTDVATAFGASNLLTPVWAGEVSAAALGVALDSWDEQGQPVAAGTVGELVITAPMPSMPLCFWNDPDDERYREAYFDVYPGVWRHGDWVIRTDHGSVIFTGRSDSTLNRHGVRLGSADVYAAIDHLPELLDCLVVGVELPNGDYWMPLFVQLQDGLVLDDALEDRIRATIAAKASPRHVPDDIIVVPGVPHTRTGKRLEVPVKRMLQGSPARLVVNPDAVDRPELLSFYESLVRPS